MDPGVPALVLWAVGALAVFAGAAALAGWLDPRGAALASIGAGLAVVGVGALAPRAPPAADEPVAITAAPLVVAADGRRTIVGTVPAPAPPPLPGREVTPIPIEAAEAEPNDTLPSANRARPGVAVDGTLTPGDRDWFSVDVGPDRRGRLVASLVTSDASVAMTLFDDAGQPLGIARTIDEVSVRTATLERALDRPRYFILLTPESEAPARYQLILAARRW